MYFIAHRCGYKEAKEIENSLEALKYSVAKKNIDGVELDIHLTKDNQFVVIHNSYIELEQHNYKIKNLTYDECCKLFYKKYNVNLSKLEEMLAYVPINKKVFIEIKGIYSNKRLNQLLKQLNDCILKYSYKDITIISFIPKSLNKFYFLNKSIPLGLLIHKKIYFYHMGFLYQTYFNHNVSMISFNKKILNYRLAKSILKNGKCLGIYTINTIGEYKKLINLLGDLIYLYKDKIYITTTIANELKGEKYEEKD